MLTRSARPASGTNPASRDTTTATMIVFVTGVIVLGLTFLNSGGSTPSVPIVNRMRVCP